MDLNEEMESSYGNALSLVRFARCVKPAASRWRAFRIFPKRNDGGLRRVTRTVPGVRDALLCFWIWRRTESPFGLSTAGVSASFWSTGDSETGKKRSCIKPSAWVVFVYRKKHLTQDHSYGRFFFVIVELCVGKQFRPLSDSQISFGSCCFVSSPPFEPASRPLSSAGRYSSSI